MTALLCGCLALLVVGVVAVRRIRARPRAPADTLRRFLHDLRHELQATTGGTVVLRGFVPCSFTAVLRIDGQDTAVPLHRLAQRAQAFPDAFPRLVQQLVEEARAGSLDRADRLRLPSAAPRLVPQVLTIERLDELAPRFGDEALPSIPLGADLVAVLAIERGESLTFVNRGLLRAWQQDFAGLYRLAIENLRRRSAARFEPTEAGDAVVLDSADGLDAARALLLDPFRAQGMRIAMPDRDCLWIGGATAAADGTLAESVAECFEAGSQSISPRVYCIDRGRIEFADVVMTLPSQRGVPRIDSAAVVGASTSMASPSAGSKPTNRSR